MQLISRFSPAQRILIITITICSVILISLVSILLIRRSSPVPQANRSTEPVIYTQPEKTEWRNQVPDFPIEVNTIPITQGQFGLPTVELKNATLEARFKNLDNTTHTITSNRGDSLSFTLNPDEEKAILLPERGTFIFYLNSSEAYQVRVTTF